MFQYFGEAATKDKVKTLFAERFKGLAGENKLVHEEVNFYMGITRRQTSGE